MHLNGLITGCIIKKRGHRALQLSHHFKVKVGVLSTGYTIATVTHYVKKNCHNSFTNINAFLVPLQLYQLKEQNGERHKNPFSKS